MIVAKTGPDYGYHHLSSIEKATHLLTALSNRKLSIFTDIFLNKSIDTRHYRLELNLNEAQLEDSKLILKFLPKTNTQSFLIQNVQGITSEIKLCLVSPHFMSNDQRQKVIESVSSFFPLQRQMYHFSNPNDTCYLKTSTASQNQLKSLGELLKKNEDTFLQNTSRSLYSSHTTERAYLLNSRGRDADLRQSFASAADVDIYQLIEVLWKNLDINQLYYYSLHEKDPETVPSVFLIDESIEQESSEEESISSTFSLDSDTDIKNDGS